MGRSSNLRTASRSIRTIPVLLSVLILLEACKIDRSAGPEREDQPGAPPPRTVFGEPPKKPAQPSRETATRDVPLDRETHQAAERRRSPDVTEEATRSRQHTPRVNESDELEKKGRVLRYQPPGASVGDPGELAAKSVKVQQSPHPIVSLIHRWANTLLSKDLNAHMALYPPVVARFYSRTNVDRETVRAEKQRVLTTLANLEKFEIYDLTIREDHAAGLVLAVFRVEWQTSNSSRRQWYRLTCSRSGSGWQIEREEQWDGNT